MCFLESPFDPLWMASYLKLYLGASIHAVIRAGAHQETVCNCGFQVLLYKTFLQL